MSDQRNQSQRFSAHRWSGRRPLGFLARKILLGLQRWQRHKAISQFQNLDDRQLADIGISRNDIPRVVDGLFSHNHRVTHAQKPPGQSEDERNQLRRTDPAAA
jgi:uncharacterized protein YjiS (DUF1127 family)